MKFSDVFPNEEPDPEQIHEMVPDHFYPLWLPETVITPCSTTTTEKLARKNDPARSYEVQFEHSYRGFIAESGGCYYLGKEPKLEAHPGGDGGIDCIYGDKKIDHKSMSRAKHRLIGDMRFPWDILTLILVPDYVMNCREGYVYIAGWAGRHLFKGKSYKQTTKRGTWRAMDQEDILRPQGLLMLGSQEEQQQAAKTREIFAKLAKW